MVGFISYLRGRGRTQLCVEKWHGVEVLTAVLCESDGARAGALERKIGRIRSVFARNGVRRVIFSREFPYRERFQCFQEVDTSVFYRSAADVLIFGWLRLHGFDAERCCVALTGGRVCPELEQTAMRLSRGVRRLCIEVPGIEGELCAVRLQRYCGMPVTPRGTAAELTVEFGPSEREGRLRLWGAVPKLDGLRICAEGIELPEDIFVPILTLLWERGSIRREQLKII